MALEIEVKSGQSGSELSQAKPEYPGMSPLKAALLYGGAGAAVGGPLGLIAGLFGGITAKFRKENFLDQQAAYSLEQAQFNNELSNEMDVADPDEQRLLGHAKRVADAGWQRLAAGDPTGREMIDNANAFIAQVINGDREARKQEQSAQAGFQRGLIGNAAEDYRKQYQTHVTDFETVDAQIARLLDLTANPDFDPNKPINKAVLVDLLSNGIGGFYRDSASILDGVAQGVGGLGNLSKYGGVAGDIIAGISTAINAKEFQATREDYNRIAFNMRKIAQESTAARMERLSEQAVQLNDFARKTGAIPADYSLGDYISGGTKELKILPVRQQPTAKMTPPTSSTPTRGMSARNFVMNQPKVSMVRPVN
jgi:hypothetical protein